MSVSKNMKKNKNKTTRIQEGKYTVLYAHKVSLKYSLTRNIGNFLQNVLLPLQSNHITKSFQ